MTCFQKAERVQKDLTAILSTQDAGLSFSAKQPTGRGMGVLLGISETVCDSSVRLISHLLARPRDLRNPSHSNQISAQLLLLLPLLEMQSPWYGRMHGASLSTYQYCPAAESRLAQPFHLSSTHWHSLGSLNLWKTKYYFKAMGGF